MTFPRLCWCVNWWCHFVGLGEISGVQLPCHIEKTQACSTYPGPLALRLSTPSSPTVSEPLVVGVVAVGISCPVLFDQLWFQLWFSVMVSAEKGSLFEGRELHLPVDREVSVWDAVRYCAGLIKWQS